MKHTPGPWKVHHHSHINKELMRLIDKKIRLYKDALKACERKQAKGLMVTDDINFLSRRLKQFKQERRHEVIIRK